LIRSILAYARRRFGALSSRSQKCDYSEQAGATKGTVTYLPWQSVAWFKRGQEPEDAKQGDGEQCESSEYSPKCLDDAE